jgi:transposase
MQLVYLPPYSPDYDPVEEAFSAIKAWIQGNRDYTRSELSGEALCDLYEMIWEAVFSSVTPEKAAGWFHDSGYLP